MTLFSRMTIATVSLVLLSVLAVGGVTYYNVQTTLLPRVSSRIELELRFLTTRLDDYGSGARADILAIRTAPVIHSALNAHHAGGSDPLDNASEAAWRQRTADLFVAELEAKPAYDKLRIISLDDRKELVRVDHSGPDGAIRVVPDSELQFRGDRPFIKDALEATSDQIMVSPITLSLNKAGTAVLTPHVPLLRVATPIMDAEKHRLGILVIDVDMRPILSDLAASAPTGGAIYVVDDRGDYLVHPDASKEFGSSLGKPTRWQVDFPALAQNYALDLPTTLFFADATGTSQIGAIKAIRLAGGPRISVLDVTPQAVVLAPLAAVGRSTLLVGLAAFLSAAAFAVLLARSLTRPLAQMTKAVEAFAHDRSAAIPTQAAGEIAVLAQAFTRMMTEVNDKTASLEREVDEHSRTEAELNRHTDRERLYGVAVQSSNDAVVTMTLDGIVTGWNPAAVRLFGWTTDEILGSSVDKIVPLRRRDEVRNILDRIRQGETVSHHETVRLHKNRRPIEVSLSVSPIKLPSGAIVGACKIARDITDQKLSEEKFRLAVEASPSGMVMIDETGKIVLVNAEAERLFGYHRQEMIGQSVNILLPTALRTRHIEHCNHFVTEPQARRMGMGRELFGRRKDGTEFPIEVGLNPIQTRSGLLVLSVIIDITESNKAKELLRQEIDERRRISEVLNNTITSMVDAVLVCDQDANILLANPSAERLMGITAGVNLRAWSAHQNVFMADGKTPLPVEQRPLLRALSGATFVNYEIVVRRQDRTHPVVLEATGGPLKPGPNERAGGLVVYRDVTEAKQIERQLRQSQKMEAVGQLTGGIAHDFNNILTVITGTIEILMDGVADRPELAAIAKMIDDAAGRGAELTRHLVAFSRRQPLEPRETNVNEIVVEAGQLLRPTLGESIEIEAMLDDGVSPALIDPSQLSTAILNLAINARDAMPGGGKLTLETANVVLDESYVSMNPGAQAGAYVLIAVSDTGSGIPAAILDKVFEPFFTTKEVGKGTGLGLSMVYGFVKQSGGHIKIYSEERQGTTIKMYLPPAAGEARRSVEKAAAEPTEGGRETILVVEDDVLVRNYVVSRIQALGYTTLSASNAAEALAIIDSDAAIDLLFTDIVMPGAMNGKQLADAAVKIRPTLPVLFTSGYTENAITHHGRLDPGVLLLTKPYRKADLARMIRAALGARTSDAASPGTTASVA